MNVTKPTLVWLHTVGGSKSRDSNAVGCSAFCNGGVARIIGANRPKISRGLKRQTFFKFLINAVIMEMLWW